MPTRSSFYPFKNGALSLITQPLAYRVGFALAAQRPRTVEQVSASLVEHLAGMGLGALALRRSCRLQISRGELRR